MPDAICLGELLIDFVSTAADVGIAGSPGFIKAPGGAPANVAVGLAKLGVDTGFVGKVGDEPFGSFLRDVVAAEGVDVGHLLIGEGARTTLAFVATRSDQTKDIAFYRNPGADMLLSPEELDREYLRTAKVFHFGSVSLSESPCREATLEAARYAKEAGALISYDPNWRPALWRDHDEARRLIWEAMRLADLAKLAEEEWEFITGTPEFEAGARRILDCGARWVVATRGEKGCWFTNGRETGELPAFRVDVVDTLGAGDAFVAALLSKLLTAGDLGGLSLAQMTDFARYANAAGALTTRAVGVIPALPTGRAIANFLEDCASPGSER
jgi:fructokinase